MAVWNHIGNAKLGKRKETLHEILASNQGSYSMMLKFVETKFEDVFDFDRKFNVRFKTVIRSTRCFILFKESS